MIVSGKGKCPHAIHGAALAFGGSNTDPIGLRATHMGLAIAGHHAGMMDLDDLRNNKAKQGRGEALALLDRAAADLPEIGNLLHGPVPKLENVGEQFDLFTRILFSCLVDADRLDTSGRAILQAPLHAEMRLERLLRHIHELAARSRDSAVKDARKEVLEDCLTAAAWPERLLSLSVPTGGGKTLSAMALALKRAALVPDLYRRVIVVIPYLSIIEQNAEVYAGLFGEDAVLEHHSGSFARMIARDRDHLTPLAEQEDEYQRRRRPETENWDAPLVVTTSVRFFESLFSNHPSDLRRVHNIARSIVILDEVQVLPRGLLAPLLGVMQELCRDWSCSFILSTATRPAFEKKEQASLNDQRWEQGTVREVVRSPSSLHARLRRVEIDWRMREPVEWSLVASWLLDHDQAVCVVNLREHAATLFDQLAAQISDEGLFHLSTRMCAAHRLKVIAEIRRRLKSGLPCRVISTQLIEAGVDLDFPVAFRALGPLDSIVQVAGRADREGKLTQALGRPGGILVVFKPADPRTPPNEYAHATGVTESLAATANVQVDDLDAMSAFFERYYGEADLGTKFQEMRRKAKFRSLADDFEMISSRTQDVFVPYGDGAGAIDQLYKIGQLTGDLRRRLQRYTVGLQPWEFQQAKTTVLSELRSESEIWIAADPNYDEKKGLQITQQTGGVFV
jgi:CRISPR-associated endonuclease/helicase Cas3